MRLYKELLLNRISNLSKFEKRLISIQSSKELHSSKIDRVIDKLEKLSNCNNQPIALAINTFANYLVNVVKARNLNSIYLKVIEFCEKVDFGNEVFSNKNIETAYLVENEWNTMNAVTTSRLPFRSRKILSQNRIHIGSNTFFVHSSDFLKFVSIAKFIDDNRKTYPFILGFTEFFIHLPVVKKRRDGQYCIYHYLNCKNTLEDYYKRYYYLEDGDRWNKFVSAMKYVSNSEIKNSPMFGIKPYMEEVNIK